MITKVQLLEKHSDRSKKGTPEFVGEGLGLSTEAYIKCLEEVMLPWVLDCDCCKTLCLATELCTMLHKQVKPNHGCQTISSATSFLTSGKPDFTDCTPT